MAQTLTSILLHVVFSTKNRAPDIRPPIRERLWRYMASILTSSGAKVRIVNGGPDHVHILFTLLPTACLADLNALGQDKFFPLAEAAVSIPTRLCLATRLCGV